jgi:integrase
MKSTPLDRDQARALLAAYLDERLAALFALAVDSGCRSAELRALHWPEVDFPAGTVFIKQALEDISGQPVRLKPPKTKAGRRVVHLAPQTVEALRAHREAMRRQGREVTTGPVFPTLTGTWIRQPILHRTTCRILRRAKLPMVRFHDLRHTSATLLLQAGVNIKIIAARLGHSSIVVTLNTYAHLLPEMQETVVAAMANILGGASAPGSDSPTEVPRHKSS